LKKLNSLSPQPTMASFSQNDCGRCRKSSTGMGIHRHRVDSTQKASRGLPTRGSRARPM
jgi:hypothetical protein